MTCNKTERLAIIGPCPPPAGGIGSHIQAIMKLLEQRSISYLLYNTNSHVDGFGQIVPIWKWRGVWMFLYALLGKERCIYLHPQRWSAWLLGAFMQRFRRKRVMLCLHNMNLHNWCASSAWRRGLIRWAVHNMFAIVCVNTRILQSVRELGVSSDRLFYLPSFLPPDSESIRKSDISPEVWSFAEGRYPLIAANGKVAWHDGQDLYGLDLLLELVVRLKPDYPDLGIVVCFWNHKPEDQPYLDKLIALAREKGVEGNLYFNTRQGPFIPVLAEADVFVRPTNTDGDATSIREALALGVPSVVSDVVERPEGSLLFRNRDLDDFEEKVRLVLSKTGPNRGTRTFVISEEDQKRIEMQVTLVRSLLSGQLPG